MPVGVVKWFNDGKGYGFITPDEGERTSSSTPPPSGRRPRVRCVRGSESSTRSSKAKRARKPRTCARPRRPSLGVQL
jgi:hypothetical protein